MGVGVGVRMTEVILAYTHSNPCMHRIWSIFLRTHAANVYTCIEGLYEIYYKMHRDLLEKIPINL